MLVAPTTAAGGGPKSTYILLQVREDGEVCVPSDAAADQLNTLLTGSAPLAASPPLSLEAESAALNGQLVVLNSLISRIADCQRMPLLPPGTTAPPPSGTRMGHEEPKRPRHRKPNPKFLEEGEEGDAKALRKALGPEVYARNFGGGEPSGMMPAEDPGVYAGAGFDYGFAEGMGVDLVDAAQGGNGDMEDKDGGVHQRAGKRQTKPNPKYEDDDEPGKGVGTPRGGVMPGTPSGKQEHPMTPVMTSKSGKGAFHGKGGMLLTPRSGSGGKGAVSAERLGTPASGGSSHKKKQQRGDSSSGWGSEEDHSPSYRTSHKKKRNYSNMSSPEDGEGGKRKYSKKGSSSAERRSKHHNPWSQQEAEALVEGVAVCGGGKWADIKKLGYPAISNRSAVDLKDKWRNLLRIALLPNPPTPKANQQGDKKREIPTALLDRVRSLASTTQKHRDSISARHRGRGEVEYESDDSDE